MKERLELAKEIEDDMGAVAWKLAKLTEHDLKTYGLLNKPDALFNDSPISPLTTYNWAKRQMIKLNMDFIGYVVEGKASIKSFSDQAAEVPNWVMRFAKEPEHVKTGIENIL